MGEMSALLQFCFIQVVGGYINVAQITSIRGNYVYLSAPQAGLKYSDYFLETGDKTPEEFLARIERTCGGRSGSGK